MQSINKLYEKKSTYTYDELFNILVLRDKICSSHFVLLKLLSHFIQNNVMINDEFYLRELRNKYYIVKHIYETQSNKSTQNTKKISISRFLDNYFEIDKSTESTLNTYMTKNYKYNAYDLEAKSGYQNTDSDYLTFRDVMTKIPDRDKIKLIKTHLLKHKYENFNDLNKNNKSISVVQLYFANYLRKIDNNRLILNMQYRYFTLDYKQKKLEG